MKKKKFHKFDRVHTRNTSHSGESYRLNFKGNHFSSSLSSRPVFYAL